MDDLTDKEIDGYKTRLEQLQSELTALIEQGDDETGPVELDQTSVGRLSRMDAIQRQAMAQETERRRRNELRKIEAAIDRIVEGEYGYCISTGELIPRARLDLDPAASTIVKLPRP